MRSLTLLGWRLAAGAAASVVLLAVLGPEAGFAAV